MNKVFKIKFLFTFLFSVFVLNSAFAQLVANAGTGKVVCPGVSFSLGGAPSATGGKAPYTYSWWPATFLMNTTTANPTCTPTADVFYTLTVTDDTGAVSTAGINIQMTYLQYVGAGRDSSVCVDDSALIGASENITGVGQGVTYSWLPTAGLSDSSLPQPIAAPAQTTTYTLTSSMAGCSDRSDMVTITIIPTPLINAGMDTTMKEGETATLHGSGGFFYDWTPNGTLTYPQTAYPNAEPTETTEYILLGSDASHSCYATDTVTVNIIKSDEPIFYNTFTPNQDGNNDNWYIGNIEKYPDNKVEIYNRYGKLVFRTTGYQNAWNGNTWYGKSFGENLPAATYFYIIDLGVDGKKYHGTVTIIE